MWIEDVTSDGQFAVVALLKTLMFGGILGELFCQMPDREDIIYLLDTTLVGSDCVGDFNRMGHVSVTFIAE